MIKRLRILRVIALVAVVSFSFEVSSELLFANGFEIEIVDLDLENDLKTKDELTAHSYFHLLETIEGMESTIYEWECVVLPLRDQHLEELPTPPPDWI